MGYKEALEAAGCKVLAFEEFGSWQGTWLAFVEYNGEKGIVEGAFGSCSYCDAFEAEFDRYGHEPAIVDGKYFVDRERDWPDNPCTKEEYDAAVAAEHQRLIDFGKSYLTGGLYDKAHYQTRLERNLQEENQEDWFDEEEREYCQWAVSQDWSPINLQT